MAIKLKTKTLAFILEAVRNTEIMTDVLTKREALTQLAGELDLRENIGKKSKEGTEAKKEAGE